MRQKVKLMKVYIQTYGSVTLVSRASRPALALAHAKSCEEWSAML
jgi:hypothetical protein